MKEIDLISRQAAINAIENTECELTPEAREELTDSIMQVPSAQTERLTDTEQRIFLAAMGIEEKICKEVDDEFGDCREPYEDSLVEFCREITRKVKDA